MLQNRVREYSTSVGTGTFSLNGKIDATYQDFVSAFGDGNPCFYTIVNMDTLEWEIGRGVCHAGTPNTLTRTAVLESSNAGSPVNFSTGLKQVFCGMPQQFFSTSATANYVPRADTNGKISTDWLKNSIGYDYFKVITYAASLNIDMNNGSRQFITLAGNITLTLTNTSTNGDVFTIAFKQDATGGRTVTWFAGITWPNGAQQPTTTANSVSYFSFVRLADGTIYANNGSLNFLIASGKTFTVNNTLTLSGTDGKTLTINNTLALSGTDGSTLNVGAGGTLAALAYKSSVDCSTSDVTGTLAAARMPALTGDVTTAAGSVATALATIITAVGPIGGSSTIPIITVDAKGRVTALTSATVSIENGTLTDVTTNNRSTLKHGFAAKFDGVSTHFEDMTGVQRALAATDLGTTMQVQVANIGINTAVDPTYKITADGGASNCLGNFSTTGTTTQAGFNLGYSGQAFRIAANGSFGGFVITDVTHAAARVFIDPSGNFAVGNTGSILGKFESRSTSGAQQALSYDGSNYYTWTVSSAGILTISGNGASKGMTIPDGLVVGSGTARAKIGGTIKTLYSSAINVSTGETDLQSYTVPANSLVNSGDSIRFIMNFYTTSNSNNKTIRVKFGTSTIYDSGAVPANAGVLTITGVIIRTGSSNQSCFVTAVANNGSAFTSPTTVRTQAVESMSADCILKATGTGGASGDITQDSTIVKFLPVG